MSSLVKESESGQKRAKASSDALQQLMESTAAATGRTFLQHLVHQLALAVDAEYAFVSDRSISSAPGIVHIVAAWHVNRLAPEGTLEIAGKPAAHALNEGLLYYPDRVAEAFPDDKWLRKHGVKAYLGVAIPGESGQADGHLGFMSRQPVSISQQLVDALRILAARCAAELRRMRLEREQQHAVRKFATTFRSAPGLITISDLDTGTYTDVNQASEAVIGYSPAELIGHTALELGIWADPGLYDSILQAIGQGSRISNREVRLIAKNGEQRTCLLSCETIEIKHRPSLLCTFLDMTEYRLALDTLHQKDLSYRALFNAGSDAILVYQLDATGKAGKIIEANDIACTWLGYSRKQLTQMSPDRIMLGEQDGDSHGKRLLAERNVLAEDFLIDYEGQRIPVECHAQLFLMNEQHTVISVIRDTRERDQAREIQNNLTAAVETSTDCIAVFDEHWQFIYANQAFRELHDLPTKTDLTGRRWPAPVCVDGNKALNDFLEHHLASESQWQDEIQIIRGKSPLWFSLSASKLSNGNIVCVIKDINRQVSHRESFTDTEQKYQTIFENALDGIYQIMPNGMIVNANPAFARILGYQDSKQLLESDSINFSAALLDDTRFDDLCNRLLKEGEYHDIEFKIMKRDGSPAWVNNSARVVRDTEGKVLHYEGILQDITARKNAEEELAKSEEKYRILIDTSQDGVFILQSGIFVYANNTLAKLLNTRPTALLGKEIDHFVSAEERDEFGEWLTGFTGNTKLPYSRDFHFILGDNNPTLACNVSLGHIRYQGMPAITGTLKNLSEKIETENRLSRSGDLDPLTGLYNKQAFNEKLHDALRQTGQRNTDRFAILALDIDRFKLINNSLGHEFGDKLLKALGARLKHCLRPGDLIARYGDDEFAVLAENVTNMEDATAVAERIHEDLARSFKIDGNEVFANASIGIVINAPHYTSHTEILRDADTAMHRAKESGVAGYVIFDRSMHDLAKANLELETDLRLAIERGEFKVYYQPVIELPTARVVSFEALLRWEHPKRGMLSPADFIRTAETTGLIIPMGWWVLERTCSQIAAWRKKFSQFTKLNASVNIANRQFAHWILPQRVARILDLTGLPPASLCLEITESVFMDNPAIATETLARLKTVGVTLQMDDFGTGYSSLSGLRNFNVDALKIDRSFVNKLEHNKDDQAIVKTIIQLATDLGMQVVAEGVENEMQAELLKSYGADYAQGYFYAKPMTAAETEKYLTQKS